MNIEINVLQNIVSFCVFFILKTFSSSGLSRGHESGALLQLRPSGGNFGANGIGKTTLLKTLIGELKPIGGKFKFVDDAKIAYFEQEHHFENDNISPLQYIQEIYPKLNEKEIRGILAKSGIVGPLALQPIRTMSGGEQSKLKLCLVTMQKANVLVLDEPTNHLDANSKEELNSLISRLKQESKISDVFRTAN